MSDTIRDWLDQVQARANAATEGPWGHYSPQGRDGHYDPVFGATPGDEIATVKRPADHRFIALMREAGPRMAAALTAVLDLHQPDTDGDCSECVEVVYRAAETTGFWPKWPCNTVRVIRDTLGVEP